MQVHQPLYNEETLGWGQCDHLKTFPSTYVNLVALLYRYSCSSTPDVIKHQIQTCNKIEIKTKMITWHAGD